MNTEKELDIIKHTIPLLTEEAILDIKCMTQGNVHKVFKVECQDHNIFVKIRYNHFNSLPDIKCDSSDIIHEEKALQCLYSLFPNVFPNMLKYDPKNKMLFLSDIMLGNENLSNYMSGCNLSTDILYSMGKQLGDIHYTLGKDSTILRDYDYYVQNLQYRIGFLNNPKADELIERLKTLPKQLIIGDLNPNNLFIDKSNQLTICDLECTHIGNKIFDIGYFAAHIMLHQRGNSNIGKDMINLLQGYIEVHPEIDNYLNVLKDILIIILLNRLNHKIIPYNTGLSIHEKEQITKGLIETLSVIVSNMKELESCLFNVDCIMKIS